MELNLGIDIGTSGVRAAVIDQAGQLIESVAVAMPAPIEIGGRPCQDAGIWWHAVRRVLRQLEESLSEIGRATAEIRALSVDGTSGTLLLADDNLNPVTDALMYNSAGFSEQTRLIATCADSNSIARGPGSALARLMFLRQNSGAVSARVYYQADWIAAKLMGGQHCSDETNALKTGYDVMNRCWPAWLANCGVPPDALPEVFPVGQDYAVVGRQAVADFGFSRTCRVVAGTTDSNAAFLATGASRIGDGVTSLGTTLAIKLLSDRPVVAPELGIYSHRIGDMWLPGGASNSGGGVLLKYFSAEKLRSMEPLLSPEIETGLDYYPLSRPGERFPVADPDRPPRLTPRPDSDAEFLQGMLEGIGRIEQSGYAALRSLGAPAVCRVFTAGGGAENTAWSRIRERCLGIPVVPAICGEASVGAARIAAGLIDR